MNTFPLDIIEENDMYRVFADIPGVYPEQVEVNVTFDHVEISVNLENESEEQYIHRERPFRGKVTRRLNFNKPINAQLASTKLTDGVLSVELPYADEAKKVSLMIN
ncbi:MAG: Hsp20/alpha crystallin family protein [Candidatus Heimdallarchaeota archaeon]|nr:Hsp20/alpha crystallin family protein [Candidatus Heimdallarchaeota archaeon]